MAFPVTLRTRHSEIVLDPGLGVVALFIADDNHCLSVQPGEAAGDRAVVRKPAVPRKVDLVREQPDEVIPASRTARMPRHLAFLPWLHLAVEFPGECCRLAVKRPDFLLGLVLAFRVFDGAKLIRLAFDLGKFLFEIKVL